MNYGHTGLNWRILSAPIEFVIDPSLRRLRVIGTFAAVGQLLTYFAWNTFAPQPFDSFWVRLMLAALGVPFMVPRRFINPFSRVWQIYASFVCWVELPLFMTLMYLLNGQNWEWFVCLAAVPLILYHLTDLRIATLGIASAWIIGLTCEKMGFLSFSNATSIGANHTLIFLFCWISAVSLRVSAASIKRAETIKTHETIAFIAHEMRTPISSVSLIAQTLRSAGELDATRTAAIAKTLEGITFKMHSKIDRVLANAKIESIPMNADAYSISACVTQALDKYAFPDERARNCVSLVCNSDFVTKGYRHEMALVITNLLSNSFTALAAIDQPLAVGDIKITIDYKPGEKHGTISFEDKGIGIATQNMPNVFDAYFTTNPKMGLGLGLAFCRSAIAKAKGKISIVSAPRQGARVLIKLPVSN